MAWKWSFGDNTPEDLVSNPAHTYLSAGQYNVKLDVSTKNGCTSSATKTITVIQPPEADFSFSPTYGAAPITVHFTNLSANGSSYQWKFGDNITSNELDPVHTYEYNDSISISLITSSLPGCSDTAVKPFIIAVATLDIAVSNVIIEKSFNDDCSYFINMAVYVQNIGTRDVTSFDILASSSDGGSIVEHWEGEFDNRRLTYPFNADFLISDCEQSVVICVEAMNPNGELDLNPANNRSCVTLSSEPEIIGPYPNPANDYVNLDIVLPSKGNLKIYNFNTMGNKLGMMTDGQRSKGYHRISMETGDFSPGIYLLKVEFNDFVKIVKYSVR
jgi:PKD repeat protein